MAVVAMMDERFRERLKDFHCAESEILRARDRIMTSLAADVRVCVWYVGQYLTSINEASAGQA